MPRIRLSPLNVEFQAEDGDTIMQAAQKLGYYWPTTCGGEGRCTTCACLVVEGLERLSERGRFESKILSDERGAAVLESPIRLACQAHVYGDVAVEKSGVRRPSETRITSALVDNGEA